MVDEEKPSFPRLLWLIFCSVCCAFRGRILGQARKSIADDVVLITGGGRGIGRKIALEIAKYQPKQVILWARSLESLEVTASEVTALGVPCDFMICDVSDCEQVYQRARETQEKYGPVTILVNNAGIVKGGHVLEAQFEDIKKTVQVNTLGNCWTMKAFLPAMISTNHGHVVNINSCLGFSTIPRGGDYSASKHATLGMMEALREELHEKGVAGVHVTTIHPYMVKNRMFEGCETRFPNLFPPLEEDHVAMETVDAILKNKGMIILPLLQYLTWVARSMLPAVTIYSVLQFTGVDNFFASIKAHD
ncbi:short-chain dehydrogenase/reductase 3-like isoform X2 [Lingula anatina]|uniref:Short-chain dehydrogenase/reductase 3 n=1 Tax=Lingula anatina TaxID=7574 RepID=A0A1S3IIB6_LINAN|nr:short-chain dehydrogenase/reductase 3-like isoform X2 [Lingula anatina]|eukprot:XP_013397868.1 short-chain dehydrogenase/reductase 3-like isoform X2 [Lingula anatina]